MATDSWEWGGAPAVILDSGSGSCKAGLADDNAPRTIFGATVGWPKSPGTQAGLAKGRRNGFLVDEDEASGALNLKRPMEHGVVTNWEDMEKIWRHAFSELQVNRGENPVLLTEAPLNPLANREQTVQLMFEEFDVPAVHMAVSGVLSLYSTGNRTGLVVECGDGVTQTVPIFDEYVFRHAVNRRDYGGRDLSEYLMRLLREERGYRIESADERRAAVQIKEKHCYVAQNFQQELRAAPDNTNLERVFELPDGNTIMAAGSERFRCPEALFEPSLISNGKEVTGIHELAWQSIGKCDVDVQRALSGNIVLAGGSMQFEGMRERMLKELTALAPPTMPIKVQVAEAPRNAAFIGGSILASTMSAVNPCDAQRFWMSKREYEEYGPSLIHERGLCLTDGNRQR